MPDKIFRIRIFSKTVNKHKLSDVYFRLQTMVFSKIRIHYGNNHETRENSGSGLFSRFSHSLLYISFNFATSLSLKCSL